MSKLSKYQVLARSIAIVARLGLTLCKFGLVKIPEHKKLYNVYVSSPDHFGVDEIVKYLDANFPNHTLDKESDSEV